MPEAQKTRRRRTPEEAKELILSAAQARLSRHGVRGLTIKDVAADSGINHGTLLHHFGSAEEMRNALLTRMTNELIEAMAEVLSTHPGAEKSIEALFDLMSGTGHIKLLAWRAMEDGQVTNLEIPSASKKIVSQIVDGITEGLDDQETARNMVLLAVSVAVGWGVCGTGFQQMFGLSQTQRDEFPRWVGQQLASINAQNPDV